MPLAKVGEIELDYERSGSGPPLLMIMGMSGTKDHWGEPFLNALRSDFETIVYNHRGVGDSSRLQGQFTIAELAADAAGLLAALKIEQAHVLGISMGGMVAQELTLAHQQLPLTLALGCTYCGGEGSALTGSETMQQLSAGVASRDRERAIRAMWEVNVSAELAAKDEPWQRFRATGMRKGVTLPVVIEQMRAISEHDTSTRLPKIRTPTLVVHGTEDRMLPVQNGHMIARLIAGARLEIMEGIGHLFFWERPERAAELVREHVYTHV
ncbi:MAG TPA: alpha/beta hydrolase [Solirubrobacteraceae bacterium]|jgi:pimeloyl-ACP methyl ester carboxylesterase